MTTMTMALLALGSNLGGREGHLNMARAELAAHPHIRIDASSSLYETTAVGGPANQPDYLNAVVQVATSLSPSDLLAVCLEIESRAGRERDVRWGARTLDIDLLCYGDLVVNEPALELPHPRLHERRFVLEPLCELNPDWRHPVSGETLAALLKKIPAEGVRRLAKKW